MQTADTEYLTRLRRLVAEVVPWQFRKKEINEDTRLQQDLSIDSLGKVMLAYRLEQEFKVDLSTWRGDVASIERIKDVIKLLQELNGVRR